MHPPPIEPEGPDRERKINSDPSHSQTVATADCNSGIGERADSNGSKPSQPVSAKARSFVPTVSQAALRLVATLLTANEAARVLHVSTATVYRLCTQGELPHVRVSNAIRVA